MRGNAKTGRGARIPLRAPPAPRFSSPPPAPTCGERRTKLRDWAPAGPWGDHAMEWRTVLAQPGRDHVREREDAAIDALRGSRPGTTGVTGYYGPTGPGAVWIEVRCARCGVTCCAHSQDAKASFEMRDVVARLSSRFPISCDEASRELLAMEVMGA